METKVILAILVAMFFVWIIVCIFRIKKTEKKMIKKFDEVMFSNKERSND